MAEQVSYHCRANSKHKNLLPWLLTRAHVPTSAEAALSWFRRDKREDAQKVEGITPNLAWDNVGTS